MAQARVLLGAARAAAPVDGLVVEGRHERAPTVVDAVRGLKAAVSTRGVREAEDVVSFIYHQRPRLLNLVFGSPDDAHTIVVGDVVAVGGLITAGWTPEPRRGNHVDERRSQDIGPSATVVCA